MNMKKLILAGLFLIGTFALIASIMRLRDAVVSDTIVFAPLNDPPVRNNLDFELVSIDGQPIRREIPLPFRDVSPGALVAPGTHQFQVNAYPTWRRPDTIPARVVFSGTVMPNKRYLIGSVGSTPILVEQRPRQ